MTLVRTLGARGKRLAGSAERGQDAVGLGLLALKHMDEMVREFNLSLPEAPEEQFRWLLGGDAPAYQFAPLYVLGRLRMETPSDAWINACLRAIERRTPQAVLVIDLLAAWGSKTAIPPLVALLGEQDDAGFADAAVDALVAIGDPALDAVLDRLGTSEEPELLADCLEICGRLPSRRAIEALQFQQLGVISRREFFPREIVALLEDFLPDSFPSNRRDAMSIYGNGSILDWINVHFFPPANDSGEAGASPDIRG